MTMTTATFKREPLSEEEKKEILSTPTKFFSMDERMEILEQGIDAYDAGDRKKALAILIQVPLKPGIANAIKSVYGVKYLVDGGFDLSEAIEEYGKDWLDE